MKITGFTTKKQAPVYDTDALQHPAIEELRESWRYRHLILQVAKRDVTTRYKRSFFGIAWSMLNPFFTMLVMVLVFSMVFGREPSYRAYLLSGLLAWNFFSEATNTIMKNMVWGSSLLKRIYIPRTAFAIASIGTGVLNLLLSLFPLFAIMLIVRVPIRLSVLFLPIPILILMTFSLGFGLLLSVAAMYFPDVKEMYSVALRGWMYLTPVIYPETLLSDNGLGWLLTINPMRYLVDIFRAPLQEGRIPTVVELLPSTAIALVTLVLGWLVFSKFSDEFAYRV